MLGLLKLVDSWPTVYWDVDEMLALHFVTRTKTNRHTGTVCCMKKEPISTPFPLNLTINSSLSQSSPFLFFFLPDGQLSQEGRWWEMTHLMGKASKQKRKKRQHDAPEKMFLYLFKLFLLENLAHCSCKPNKSKSNVMLLCLRILPCLYYKLYALVWFGRLWWFWHVTNVSVLTTSRFNYVNKIKHSTRG